MVLNLYYRAEHSRNEDVMALSEQLNADFVELLPYSTTAGPMKTETILPTSEQLELRPQ